MSDQTSVKPQLKNNKKRASKQVSSSRLPLADTGRSLGTTTESASTTRQLTSKFESDGFAVSLDNNKKRYALQRIAKAYHPEHRIGVCMSTIKDNKNIEVHYDDRKRHAHYRNLMRCDNVWMCPVCASRISSHRANEIREAYASAVENFGWSVVMVTYTMKHNKKQTVEANIEAMRDARRNMRSGRKWQAFKEKWGYKGCISSLEPTYGMESGWHVHVHELMFLKSEITDNIRENETPTVLEEHLHDELAQWWIDSLKKVGRTANKANGLKVDATDEEITWYIAKFGKLPTGRTWDAGLELTKSMYKSNGGGLHPFEILEYSKDLCVPEAERALLKALWHEYVIAFKGRRQTFWTNGLKDLLQVEHIEEDGDIEELEGKQVLIIAREMWRDIVYTNKRAELLNVVMETRCNARIVNYWLRDVAINATSRRSRFRERKE